MLTHRIRRLSPKRAFIVYCFAGLIALNSACNSASGPETAGARSNPVPSISTIAPPSGSAASGALTITITGSNLVAGSVIQWNGASLPTTFVSSSQLLAVIPASALSSPGTAQVQIFTPGPGGGTSNSLVFNIQNGAPTVLGLSPATMPAGSAPFSLTITGSSFVSGAAVLWNGSPLPTTYVSSTQLSASVPSAILKMASNVQIAINNPPPGGGLSNVTSFSVISTVVRFAYAAHYNKNTVTMYIADAASGELRHNGYVLVGSVPTYLTTDLSQKFLYVVNYGSNNISAFQIETSGKLTEIPGSPFPAGTGPLVPRVDPSNSFLLVANWDSSDISVFGIDAMSGALTQVAGSPFSVQGVFPDDLEFDPSGKFLFVPNFDSSNVAVLALDAATGALAPVMNSPFASGLYPTGVAVHPSGGYLYVTHNDQNGTVSTFAIDSLTGVLTPSGTPVAAGEYPTFIRVTPDGKFAYATNFSDDISGYSVSPADGSLTPLPGSPFLVGSNLEPIDIQMDASGQRLYASSFQLGATAVTAFDINPTTGALTLSSSTRTMDRAIGLNLVEDVAPASVSPKFAYTLSASGNTIAAFSVDAATGALTAAGTSATESNPRAAAVHPSGNYVYVANAGANTISAFSIDSATGSVTSMGSVPTGVNPQDLTIEPSGRFLYAVCSGSDSVSIHSINAATGTLSMSGSIATGQTPIRIAFDPTVRWAYVTNIGSGTLDRYSVNLVTGALSNRSTSPTPIPSPSLITVDPKARAVSLVRSAELLTNGIYMPDGSLFGLSAAVLGAAPSAMAIDPVGRFLFIAIAGASEVSTFALDPASGASTLNGVGSVAGNPVFLAVDPSGRYLYVVTSGSGDIQVYSIDAATGLLTSTGSSNVTAMTSLIISRVVQ